jgi:hypothetical protein
MACQHGHDRAAWQAGMAGQVLFLELLFSKNDFASEFSLRACTGSLAQFPHFPIPFFSPL